MQPTWHFSEARPGDRARESQVEKFFNSDAVANRADAIVREGIQNSLDAAPENSPVRVRIALGRWPAAEAADKLPRYMSGFNEHFEVDSVRNRMSNPPETGETFRYLTFEDFGTTGLTGDPALWWPDEDSDTNPFFNYFRAEGISDKSANARGRHGVGRLVFMFASRVHSMFGLTRRNDENGHDSLLMGTSVLRNHRLQDTPYLPDGWFGIPDPSNPSLTLPVEDDGVITAFCDDFALARSGETGLSIVVPWLDPDVTFPRITEAVLAGYFHPVLSGRLSVNVVSENGDKHIISAESIDSVINNQKPEVADRVRPFINLARADLNNPARIQLNPPSDEGAPKWESEVVPENIEQDIHEKLEAGETVPLNVPIRIRPKDGQLSANSSFHIILQRDANVTDGQIIFVRTGIVISDVRPRRTSGIRALVIIPDGALAKFLGDAENPAHTQWQKEAVRGKYVYAPASIQYVVDSVPRILSIISEQRKEPDSSILLDLFSLPADAGQKKPADKPSPKPGADAEPPMPPVEPTPKRYRVQKRDGGFVVRAGDPDALLPAELLIRVAYDVRRGSPFAKYNRADFRLDSGAISCEPTGCSIAEFSDNEMRVLIEEHDFELNVAGFDTRHRDLYIDVKAVSADNSKDGVFTEEELSRATPV